MNQQKGKFSRWWLVWRVVLGILIAAIIGLTVAAGFLAGSLRWSAMLTGSAALIAAASVLVNQINGQRSVQPLPIIEWHEEPGTKATMIVFRNEGTGTALLQDVMLVVEIKHPKTIKKEYARHAWAQLILRPHEVIHTVVEKDKFARLMNEAGDEALQMLGSPTHGQVQSITLIGHLCNVHGDDLGKTAVRLTEPFQYGTDAGTQVGNWWQSDAHGTLVVDGTSYPFYFLS